MLTNLELCRYAEAQLGNPYWWGTFGQKATNQLHYSLMNQYKSTYNAPLYADWKDQLGKRCHDCVGLIKGAIWSAGDPEAAPKYASNGCPDVSANQMHANSANKGPVSTIPEVKGLYVWRNGHIGIYLGQGKVIEARGHRYGVVKTNLKERDFTHWGTIPYIKYVEEEETLDISKLTDEDCYEIITRANSYAAGLEPSQDWAKTAVKNAVDKGITDGKRPKAYATRMEVMGMVTNALK